MGAISELSGNQSSADPQTITQRLNYVVEQHPDSIAIVCTHQLPDLYGFCSCAANETKAPYLRWTYATLHQAVCRLANGLKNQGLAPGTPMLVVCENQIEQVVAALAAFAADFIHVPVNPASLAHAEEVQHMVNTVMEFHETERMAIIAKDENTARRIDEKLNIPPNAVKICWQASEINEWICLQSFFDNPGDPVQPLQPEQAVFFTSGSTALPKGCLIRAARWFDVLIPSLSLGSTCPGNSVAVPVLMNHAFGFICTILPLLCGATVVFASHRFKPQETAEALQRENCTHAAMVPTMVRSLAEILDQPTKLQQVTFAGMAMTPQVLRRCQQSLGKCKVENFYGMTEGVFVSTGPVADPDVIVKGYDVAIGRPVQACQIRVCAEGEQTPLSRGTAGHLHFSGPSVVNGYLGSNTHDFYEADGQVWFKTGDQVILDDDQLYYVGRYKDMIVRGGENISLSKIEAILAQLPQSHALQPQVVAAPDPIAGEAPLAVVTTDIEDQELVKQMKERVRSSLGVKYVPSSFVSLRKLGLDDYPRTAVGKVQKMKLTEIVRHFCQQSQSEDIEQPPDSLEQLIQAVWGRVLGMQTDSIDVNAPLSLFADSITLLTARDRIQKATARSVPLAQWLDATTIAEQITLLQNGSNFKEALAAPTQPQHGPLKVGDMVHLGGDDDAFIKTRTAVEKILEPHGLTWGEVRHVTPCTDFVQAIARSRVVNTWNIRTSVLSKGASIEQARAALKATLAHHPLMLAFMAIDPDLLGPELGLYVMVRSEKFFDQCILDYKTVATRDDLRSITMDYPFPDHTLLPGPLFRALIVFVEETNSAAIITNTSHTVLDAIYHRLFNEDLDRALGGQSLEPHIPFTTWADSYHALRHSPAAETSVNFHVNYLRDLHQHLQALWPHPTYSLSVSPERATHDGHVLVFSAPSITHLHQKHPSLTPAIVLKAALALLAISHTNHSHALFLNLEANRSRFPFLPASLTSHHPFHNATDIAGPTFSGVLNLLAYNPTESALDFLLRVHRDQASLTAHASVPWHTVFHRLNLSADILPSIAESLIFNWMPGLGAALSDTNPYQNMEILQTHIRTKLGLLASAAAGGPDGTHILLLLHGALANTSTVWVQRAAEQWKRIALWLADEGSWHKPVSGFVDCQ